MLNILWPLGGKLNGMLSNKNLASKREFELSGFKIKPSGSNYDNFAEIFEDIKAGKLVSKEFINFESGFKAGAAYYFKQAKKYKKNPKPPHNYEQQVKQQSQSN